MNRRDLVTKLPFLGILPFFQVVKQEKYSLSGVVPTDEDIEKIYHGLLANIAKRELQIVYPLKINLNITKGIYNRQNNYEEMNYSKIYICCFYYQIKN